MTETSILPGPVPAPSDAGIDMVPPGPGGDESEGGNRRRLLILGAIAGVIVLAAVAYLLLHKNSSSTPTVVSPVPSTGTVHNPAPGGKSHGKSGGKTLPTVAKHAPVRDPFQALVNPPVQTNGGPASTTTVSAAPSASATTPVVTQPSTTPPTSVVTSPPAGTGTGQPLWIQLLKTKGQSATFKVGYAHHKFRIFNVQAPKPSSTTGTVFGKVFALIGVQSGDATLQIGDDTPFDLTEGVSHVV